jgi:hypothetical protein
VQCIRTFYPSNLVDRRTRDLLLAELPVSRVARCGVVSSVMGTATPSIRVGLLAYGAIGHEHNQAVQATEGLDLAAVCDTNPERISAALELLRNIH